MVREPRVCLHVSALLTWRRLGLVVAGRLVVLEQLGELVETADLGPAVGAGHRLRPRRVLLAGAAAALVAAAVLLVAGAAAGVARLALQQIALGKDDLSGDLHVQR